MLHNVVLATRVLDESDSAFPVNGFMNPHFHNDGETTVSINNQEIAVGDSFSTSFPGCVMQGTMNIRFNDVAGKTNKLIVHYGMVVGAVDFETTNIASRSITPGCN